MKINFQICKSIVYVYIKASIRKLSTEYLEMSRILPCPRLENLWWALDTFGTLVWNLQTFQLGPCQTSISCEIEYNPFFLCRTPP